MNRTPENQRRLLDKRLAQLRERDYIPTALLHIVEEVCSRQIEAAAKAQVGPVPEEAVTPADQHAQGAPLLRPADFPYDADQAAGLLKDFLELLLGTDGPAGAAAKVVADALADGSLRPEEVFTAFLNEDEEYFLTWGERIPDAPRLLIFLAQSSLAPSMEAVALALAPHHDADTVWTHQHCPVCGALPLIAELRDKPGFRYATCSLCRTSYRIPRLACAFCGETDAEKLSYFTAEEETGYRVEVCQSCKLYIKAADFRELDKDALPLIDDLESLSLDVLAGNEGFKRPTLSGLGF